MLDEKELNEIFNILTEIDNVVAMREKITDPAALTYTEQERHKVEEFLSKYDY